MSDSLGLDEPPQPRDTQAYRVLARKYRPQNFSQLIGQDAMVTTLGNAIRRDRLAHAFLLTGVRGVGKTSTARLIAKALNCIGPDGDGGPTINPCGVCEPCRAIAEGRHIDVMEMDAASNTGINDIREIIEASRYAAVSARYKIYIIDEVHMLSNAAFNGLLKTLEEPPAHVKFLFATTEVHKVPVTVLSRCQRFDLRRIPADLLQHHFEQVIEAEGFSAEPEALALIARAAEGSARDGLSILDQAIAHADLEGAEEGEGARPMVMADAVRAMLGLSDRGAIRLLFDKLVIGDAGEALKLLRGQYDLGVDPLAVLRTLLETVHATSLTKLGADLGVQQSAEEREAFERWAEQLSFPVLHRLWQLLLRGHDEVARAALPIEACEMALLRIVHASQLPDPGELAKMLAKGEVPKGGQGSVASQGGQAAPSGPTAEDEAPVYQPLPENLQQIADWLSDKGQVTLEGHVRNLVRTTRFAPPEIDINGSGPLPSDFVKRLMTALKQMTGVDWTINLTDGEGQPTLREAREAAAAAEKAAILNSPIVAAAMAQFPEAELVGWTKANTE